MSTFGKILVGTFTVVLAGGLVTKAGCKCYDKIQKTKRKNEQKKESK